MPYTEKQHRVFAAIAHGWKPRKGSLASISQSDAAKMASEGVKEVRKRRRAWDINRMATRNK